MARNDAGDKSNAGSARSLLAQTGRRIASIAFCIASLAIAIYAGRSFFRGDTPDDAYYTTYICTETGKAFRHRNALGESIPIYSEYSGKNTGMPAEACYWTADGRQKDEPTWVLLNEELGKTGPTFCPDCGRLVVGHNPRPGPNVKAPPTRPEFLARKATRGTSPAQSD